MYSNSYPQSSSPEPIRCASTSQLLTNLEELIVNNCETLRNTNETSSTTKRRLPIYVVSGATIPKEHLQSMISNISPIGIEIVSFEKLLSKLSISLGLSSYSRLLSQSEEQIIMFPIIEENIKKLLDIDEVTTVSKEIVYRIVNAMRFWNSGHIGQIGEFEDTISFLESLIEDNKHVNSSEIVKRTLQQFDARLQTLQEQSRFSTVSKKAQEIIEKQDIPEVHIIVIDPYPNDHEQRYFFDMISSNPQVNVHILSKSFAPFNGSRNFTDLEWEHDFLSSNKARQALSIRRTVGAHAEGYAILDAIDALVRQGVSIDNIAITSNDPDNKAETILRALEQAHVSYPNMPIFDVTTSQKTILANTSLGAAIATMLFREPQLEKFLYSRFSGLSHDEELIKDILSFGDTIDALALWLIKDTAQAKEQILSKTDENSIILDDFFVTSEIESKLSRYGITNNECINEDKTSILCEIFRLSGLIDKEMKNNIVLWEKDNSSNAVERQRMRAERIIDFCRRRLSDHDTEEQEKDELDEDNIQALIASIIQYINACKRLNEPVSSMLLRLFVSNNVVYSIAEESDDSQQENTSLPPRPRLLISTLPRIAFVDREYLIICDLDASNEAVYAAPDAMSGLEYEALKEEEPEYIDRWFQQARTYSAFHDIIEHAQNILSTDTNSITPTPIVTLMYNSKAVDGSDIPPSSVLCDICDELMGPSWKEDNFISYSEKEMMQDVLTRNIDDIEDIDDNVVEESPCAFEGSMPDSVTVSPEEIMLASGHEKDENGLWKMSASEVEAFHQCPMKWLYSSYVLGGRDNSADKLSDARTMGNLVHDVLHAFYEQRQSTSDKFRLTETSLADIFNDDNEEITSLISQAIDDEEDKRLSQGMLPTSEKEKKQIEKRLFPYIEHVLNRDSMFPKTKDKSKDKPDHDFVPYEFEKKIEGEYGGIHISGRIDRIDKRMEDGKQAFLIVDYKGKVDNHQQQNAQGDCTIFPHVPSYIQSLIYASLYYKQHPQEKPQGYGYRAYRGEDKDNAFVFRVDDRVKEIEDALIRYEDELSNELSVLYADEMIIEISDKGPSCCKYCLLASCNWQRRKA